MIWKNRVFTKMFAAYGLSTLGAWFDFIAVAILLGFVWQADPMTMALLPIMYAGPGILLGQFAGIVADRSNKLKVMILADIIRAVFTLLLIAAPSPFWALLIILCRSAANVFHTPAQQAMTRQVVSDDQLLKATTLNGTVFQLGKVIGPLLGGSVAAVISPALCMVINAVGFIVSTLLLLSIKNYHDTNVDVVDPSTRISVRKSWQEGWSLIFGNRILFVSMIYSSIVLIAIQLVDAQFPVFLREKVPAYPELLGWKITAIGCGALLTVRLLNRVNEIKSYGWILGGGTALIGIMFAWLGLYQSHQSIIWLLIASFIGGIGTGLSSIGSTYLRQKETPKEALGRVTGIFESVSSVVFIVAPLLGGILITTIGVSVTFTIIGFILGIIGFLAILLQAKIWGQRDHQQASVVQVTQQASTR